MAEWIEINSEVQFDNEVQHGSVITLFGSSSNMAWNMVRGPIQAFVSGPIPVPDFVRVLYVDKDKLPQIAQKRNVTIVPTARFLRNGKKMSELTGNQVKPENIQKLLDQAGQQV